MAPPHPELVCEPTLYPPLILVMICLCQLRLTMPLPTAHFLLLRPHPRECVWSPDPYDPSRSRTDPQMWYHLVELHKLGIPGDSLLCLPSSSHISETASVKIEAIDHFTH